MYLPVDPVVSSLRSQAIVALVLNACSVLFCSNLVGIAGAICAGVAIGKVNLDLAAGRKLVRWAWGLLAGGIALAALMTVAGMAVFLLALYAQVQATP